MKDSMKRETLRYERQAAQVTEQVLIEGEATLPGSMRDAVTVLSVQASAHLTGVQAAQGRIAVRGKVGFQVLYTQGALTRIRVIETTCDFTHSLSAEGAAGGMRAQADVLVREVGGVPGSGRLALSAQLEICAAAYEQAQAVVIAAMEDGEGLCTKMQTIALTQSADLGGEKTLVREEFDLPEHLNAGGVLFAGGTATVTDVTGGNGRVGVSGVAEMRVWHRNRTPGEALVVTAHEAPFQVTIPAQIAEGVSLTARAEVRDAMADSAESDRKRTLRAEAEVCVKLYARQEEETTLLADVYSTQGPALEVRTQELLMHSSRTCGDVRESLRIQAALPGDAPPMETLLMALARPLLWECESAGRRTKAEGVMDVTLLYLPVDSDIPYAVRTREPFAMTFPLETGEGARCVLSTVECAAGPTTSDRAELRLVMSMTAREDEVNKVTVVTDIEETPEEKQEKGFVLVWPAPGETRWETARRLRVPQESLRPAGPGAVMAFKR